MKYVVLQLMIPGMVFDHPGHFLPGKGKGRYPYFFIGVPSGWDYCSASDDRVMEVKLKGNVVVMMIIADRGVLQLNLGSRSQWDIHKMLTLLEIRKEECM
jgi:hypothetical protein